MDRVQEDTQECQSVATHDETPFSPLSFLFFSPTAKGALKSTEKEAWTVAKVCSFFF